MQKGVDLMKSKDQITNKRKSSFFLTEEARRIIEKKVEAWGISKSGVVELALRNLSDKGMDRGE